MEAATGRQTGRRQVLIGATLTQLPEERRAALCALARAVALVTLARALLGKLALGLRASPPARAYRRLVERHRAQRHAAPVLGDQRDDVDVLHALHRLVVDVRDDVTGR